MAEHGNKAETYLALTALILALCSLVVTTGQLLGQYFATADGLRRCQPSVMGPWAKRTRLRWRWSQFRFEILFTTPDIYLEPFVIRNQYNHGTYEPIRLGLWVNSGVWIMGSHESKVSTMVTSSLFPKPNDEHVCWLHFLASLHQHEYLLDQHGVYQDSHGHPFTGPQQRVGPALTYRERSWDFMSPDMVRPHATINVSDLAVLARRLGMIWTDFRPEDGVLRAEGNGHVLTSTVARSVGIVVQYLQSGPQLQSSLSPLDEKAAVDPDAVPEELYIPVRRADALGFGILLRSRQLDVPDFRIGTIEEVLASMDSLDPSGEASKTIQDVRGLSPRVTFGFSDIIPMASPMMRLRGSGVIRLPIPSEYSVGLTCHTEGFVVFHHRLREYREERRGQVSARVDWVLEQYEALKASNEMWEDEVKANERANGRSIEFLDRVQDCWEEASLYFVDLRCGHRRPSATMGAPSISDQLSSSATAASSSSPATVDVPPLRYMDLVASHLTQAVNYWGDAWARIRGDDDAGGPARNHYGLRNWIAEGMHCYFDYLPSIVKDMRQRGYTGSDEIIHEAWFMLMFRAFCWWRCHWMMHGRDMVQPAPPTVPAKYWESRLPVYIG